MAPRIIKKRGFESSCGDFDVSVVKRRRTSMSDSASILVIYNKWIDLDHAFHAAETPWKGGDVSVDEIEKLLDSAKIPPFIQQAGTIGMILTSVNGTLEEIKDDAIQRLPSILVKIVSDKETTELGDSTKI